MFGLFIPQGLGTDQVLQNIGLGVNKFAVSLVVETSLITDIFPESLPSDPVLLILSGSVPAAILLLSFSWLGFLFFLCP